MLFLSLKTQASQDSTKSSRKQTSCDIIETVESLGQAVAVAQHHDAITGTEKQYVTEDYHYRLSKSTQDFLHCATETTLEIGQYNCPYLNISQCEATDNQHSFIVSVYNPLPRTRSSIIRVPISYHGDVTVSKMVSINIILFSIYIFYQLRKIIHYFCYISSVSNIFNEHAIGNFVWRLKFCTMKTFLYTLKETSDLKNITIQI